MIMNQMLGTQPLFLTQPHLLYLSSGLQGLNLLTLNNLQSLSLPIFTPTLIYQLNQRTEEIPAVSEQQQSTQISQLTKQEQNNSKENYQEDIISEPESAEESQSEFEPDDENSKKRLKGLQWTKQESAQLTKYYKQYDGQWKKIIKHFAGRNISQLSQKLRKLMNEECQHRKNKWAPEEDEILIKGVKDFGRDWVKIAGLLEGRNCKQVRERYVNKLDPKLNQENWTTEEDLKLIDLYHQHGKRWSTISKFLENRSQNSIKNRFYYAIQKKYGGTNQLNPRSQQ